MTTKDLVARGFQPNPRLMAARSHCEPCGTYRWFPYWNAPKFGIRVAACETCGTVPASEDRFVNVFPVVDAIREHTYQVPVVARRAR